MKIPIILFLPIPILLLVAGCTTENIEDIVDMPTDDTPIINETSDNMTILNNTNMSSINTSEVIINGTKNTTV